jgi:hypothetical protein
MKCIPYAEGPNHAAALELGEYRHSREMNIFTITHYYPLSRAQAYLEGILLTRDYQPGFEEKKWLVCGPEAYQEHREADQTLTAYPTTLSRDGEIKSHANGVFNSITRW